MRTAAIIALSILAAVAGLTAAGFVLGLIAVLVGKMA